MDKDIRAKVKLTLTNNGRGFFGPGIFDLMKLIRVEKSTKKAAARMGLSYSKALKIIKRCEDELGESIVVSQRGGASYGASDLTDLGLKIIASYEEFLKSYEKNLANDFDKYFPYLKDI